MAEERKYGEWKSPITSEAIVASNIRLSEIRVDNGEIYWSEGRPTEGGRNVVVRWNSGNPVDVTPAAPWNVRTRVHEYGGGAYQVADGVVYFSNFSDQRIYKQVGDTEPVAITPADSSFRYSDAVYDKKRNLLISVREDHSAGGEHHEPVNTVVAVSLDEPDGGKILASGHDFYSSPRLNSDGKYLAFLSWNHPQMPWDGTSLWASELDASGSVKTTVLVAGGTDESITQPEWSPDGEWLYFVSDRGEGGWWNLYRWKPSSGGEVQPVYPKQAEFGTPHWTFAQTTYGFADSRTLVCIYGEAGVEQMAVVDTESLKVEARPLPICSSSSVRVTSDRVVFIAGFTAEPSAVVSVDLRTRDVAVLRKSSSGGPSLDGYISVARPIEFPTTGDRTAFAYHYPPQNRDFRAPAGEKPPLLVKIHGGPTAATSPAYNPGIQYWTSRGFAVVDVNYGGSTGYGRPYRERLRGAWGQVDVDDCVAAARHLAAAGLADGDRLCIDGASAGGYTTLAALVFRDAFRAGASHFGVSDLEALAKDTHKFEARYLDGLIGRYPEEAALYKERSPITHADRLSSPVVFFQGDQDKVVPPNQAESMVEVLRRKGVPVAYVLFEGEQHGFRKAENIRRALDGELYFYSRVGAVRRRGGRRAVCARRRGRPRCAPICAVILAVHEVGRFCTGAFAEAPRVGYRWDSGDALRQRRGAARALSPRLGDLLLEAARPAVKPRPRRPPPPPRRGARRA